MKIRSYNKKSLKVNKHSLHIKCSKWKYVVVLKGGRFLFWWKRIMRKFFFGRWWKNRWLIFTQTTLMATGYLASKLLITNWRVIVIIVKSCLKFREIYIIRCTKVNSVVKKQEYKLLSLSILYFIIFKIYNEHVFLFIENKSWRKHCLVFLKKKIVICSKGR